MARNTHMGNDLEDIPQPDGSVTADGSMSTAELSRVFGLDQKTAAYIRYVTLQIAQTVPHALTAILFGSVARHNARPLRTANPYLAFPLTITGGRGR
jgi:hypothetical protein